MRIRGVKLSIFKTLVLLLGLIGFGTVYTRALSGIYSVTLPSDWTNKLNQYTKLGSGDVRATEEFMKIEYELNNTRSKYEELQRDREELQKALKAKEKEDEEKEARRALEEKQRKLKEAEAKKQKEEREKELEKQKKEEEEKKKKEEDDAENKRLAPYLSRMLKQWDEEYKMLKQPVSFPGFEGPLEPSGNKVAILSATDGNGYFAEIPLVPEMAMASREEYAKYHGYVHQFINITDLRTEDDDPNIMSVWYKFRAIRKTFDMHPEVEWVWWLDQDVIFMTPEIDLAHHILNKEVLKQRLSYGQGYLNDRGKVQEFFFPNKGEVDVDKIDFIISQDYLGINAGSFFVRRSDVSFLMLDLMHDPIFINHDFKLFEQSCITHLLLNHEEFRKRVGLVPQRTINAFDWVYAPERLYQDGDLLVHFAGRHGNDDFLDTWDSYWARRKLLPKEHRIAPVKTLNPYRLPDCVKKIQETLTDEEKEKIKIGGMSRQEINQIFGERLSDADLKRLERYQTYTNPALKEEEQE